MPDFIATGRIAFRWHFDVRALDDERVTLFAEGGKFMLRGKLYVVLLPFLQASLRRQRSWRPSRARRPPTGFSPPSATFFEQDHYRAAAPLAPERARCHSRG